MQTLPGTQVRVESERVESHKKEGRKVISLANVCPTLVLGFEEGQEIDDRVW